MKTQKYSEHGKKIPPLLGLLIPVIIAFAVYFYVRVLYQLNNAFYYYDAKETIFALLFCLILFILFLNYLLTLFWLYSGNRAAWGRMMRLSLLYILLLVLQRLHISNMAGDVFHIGPVLMLFVLIFIMSIMLLKPIRDYYTPPYTEEVPITKWLLYIVAIDPFKKDKIAMS